MNALNLLVVYEAQYCYTNAVADYLSAFGKHSRCRVFYLDASDVADYFDLSRFDAVFVNYCAITMIAKRKRFFKKFKKYGGVKIVAVQDEYDNAIKYHRELASFGLDAIVTSVPAEADRRKVYWGPELSTVDFIHSLTGYVTADMLSLRRGWKPLHLRQWLLGYRGRRLPSRYGELGFDKYRIGVEMEKRCRLRGIGSNIAVDEATRIYGEAWPRFIANCVGMLGSESGSNVFDFSGKLAKQIRQYEIMHPGCLFETIREKFLVGVDGVIKMNQASPRLFETIAHGTIPVLFEGAYSGVVEPWKHYLPLKKDFSNADEILDALGDFDRMEEMRERAFEDVIASGKWSYAEFVSRVDSYLESKIPIRKGAHPILAVVGFEEDIGTCNRAVIQQMASYPSPTIRTWTTPPPMGGKCIRLVKRQIKKCLTRVREA